MKIGILTFHLPTNFGANLQAFASSRYFSSLGHRVYVYNYARPEDLNNIRNTSDIQKAAHQSFVDSRLPLTRRVTTTDELREVTKELGIELIVVGADAVWRQPKDENIYFAQWALNDPELAHVKVVSMSPAHMGDGFKSLEDNQRDTIADCLRKFSYISVRDEWTRYVINRDLFDGEPFVERIIPDPVFSLSIEDSEPWVNHGIKAKEYVAITLPKDWLKSRRTRVQNWYWFQCLKFQVHRRGLKLVELPLPEGVSGLSFDYTVPYPIDPIQWFLWLKNAKAFVGLRFHAVVSCCASGTPFFSFDSYTGKGTPEKSKIFNLLNDTPFEKYRTDEITSTSPQRLAKMLDAVQADDILKFRDEKRRVFSQNMNQMLAVVKGKERIIETLKYECTSCAACYNVCPVKAITMEEDAEGFYAPKVDYDKCIGCGKCDHTCPQLNQHDYVHTLKAWYGYHKDDAERRAASSGGVFGAIADMVLSKGGVVYGAAFNYDSDVLRLECRSTDEVPLAALKKSKYVQSFVGDAFILVKKELEHGREVFLCGPPCQVDGLCQVLKKEYENLLTADFVCHGVPPMPLLRAHLKFLGFEKVTDIDFRPKNRQWVDDFQIKNGALRRNYTNYWGNDAYFSSFEKARSTHRSCGNCPYCNGNRAADITLADFWGYKDYDKSIYDPKGISLIMANTAKGISVIESIDEQCIIKSIDIEYSQYAYKRLRGGKTTGYYDMNERNAFFAEMTLLGFQKTVGKNGLQIIVSNGKVNKAVNKLKKGIKRLIQR